MAYHNILLQNAVQATNIDALNRSAKGSADLDNGNIFALASVSSTAGEGEVWVATAAATPTGVWMAYEPEVVVTAGKYKGIDPDVRNFYIPSGEVFTAFKPKVGDVITVTAPAFDGARTAEGFAIGVGGAYTLHWNATASATLFTLKYIATTYISVGNERVVAYKMEVVVE